MKLHGVCRCSVYERIHLVPKLYIFNYKADEKANLKKIKKDLKVKN